MKSVFKPFFMMAVCLLVSVPSAAQEATRGLERIDGPVDSSSVEFKYRKKWLIAVGINYDHDASEESSSVELVQDPPATDIKSPHKLQNAQSDAEAVHQLLVEKFGFEKQEESLIVGHKATGTMIREQIGDLTNSGAVTAEDCVLVYFSGHGVLQRMPANNSQVGYLLPDDVELQADGKINPGRAIEMNFIVQSLLNCPAKHKLLILDCCHSGAVFRLIDLNPGHDRDSNETALDNDEFKAEGFQVFTASRDNQKASDGRNGHSPFTNALLVSLKTTPLLVEQANGHRVFTANQLFETMTPYLRGDGISKQQRGRIGEDLGQFHFMPDRAADFSEEVGNDLQRNELLAMTPTTFGNWWAYEVPWFMPGLRLAILQQNPSSRSVMDELDPKSLLEAARYAQSNSTKSGSNLTDVFNMRYRHLEKVLNAKDETSQRAVMQEIADELEQHTNGSTPTTSPSTANEQAESGPESKSVPIKLMAEDFHYLGVLYQLLGDSTKSENYYTIALAMYFEESKENPSGPSRSLEALCQLDAGILSTSRGDFAEARERIKKAREQFGDKAPWPFRVFALCREADVYRREGRFQLSQDRMEEAVHVLKRFDAEQSTLLAANTMKGRAWAHMEGWDFKSAGSDFEAAKMILKSHQSRVESSIDQLHVLHGQAMIERYQGRGAEALSRYRNLTLDIANYLTDLEKSDDEDMLNYSEVRSLLFGRLVNSLERQADCSLFGEVPDFAEAADDYRRAIHECRNLSKEKRYSQLIDLLYRRAIAISLHAARRDADDSAPESATQEFELAKWICAEAEELLEQAKASKDIIELPFKTTTVQKLAFACLSLQPQSSEPEVVRKTAPFNILGAISSWGSTKPMSGFDTLLSELARDATACDRDELERLMFLHKILIDYRERFKIDEYESLKHVGQLLAYCRSACRLKEPDPQLLAYLRPYYDSAFIAHAELLPGHTKELVEIAFEATHGTPYLKSGIVQPLLATYIARGRCYLLVDAPGSVSKTFTLNDVASAEDFIVASDEETDDLPLPDEVRQILRALEQRRGQDIVELRWRDPVLGIGVELMSPAETSRVVALKPDFASQSIPDQRTETALKFPFSLPGIIHLKYAEDRNPLCVKPTNKNLKTDGEGTGSTIPQELADDQQ